MDNSRLSCEARIMPDQTAVWWLVAVVVAVAVAAAAAAEVSVGWLPPPSRRCAAVVIVFGHAGNPDRTCVCYISCVDQQCVGSAQWLPPDSSSAFQRPTVTEHQWRLKCETLRK